MLNHVSFDNTVLALNRYEFNNDDTVSLLNGLEINRHNPMLLPDYDPSIWTQDVWVWKSQCFSIDNVNFCLGITACDNYFAYLLNSAGYTVYNPSFLVSMNHYDRLSSVISEDGILKGAVSKKRDPQMRTFKDDKLYLKNVDDIIDKYTVSTTISIPRTYTILSQYNIKSVHELQYNIDSLAQFSNDGYWRYSDKEKYFEIIFDKVYNIAIIDIMGKPCSRTDMVYGYISKFKLQYCISDDKWRDYDITLNGVPRQNGNFIRRNYLEPSIYCNRVRIYSIESKGIPAIKVRLYGNSIVSNNKHEFTLTEFNASWQKPVSTEYTAFTQLNKAYRLPFNYFAFPWASLIDEIWVKGTALKMIISEYKNKEKVYFTVIQHMRYAELFSTFQSLNIRYVFTPHCTHANRCNAKKFGIELFGFQLYATVKRDMTEALIPMKSRLYLTSFIGQYDSAKYLTDIRLKIFKIFSQYNDCLIKRRGKWHFQGMVYGGELNTDTHLESEYKTALSNSKFSLCPSGSGPNSIRIWESMSYGSIPVILADTLILPTIKTMKWTDAIILWKEKDIDSLYTYLHSITVEEIESKSKACLELFYTYFRPETFSRVIVEEMDAIINYNTIMHPN